MAVHTSEYGTLETGRFDGTYRHDTYTNTATGEKFRERNFAAGPKDDSPVHNSMPCYGGQYDPKCSCCWLGFGHTEQAHAARR